MKIETKLLRPVVHAAAKLASKRASLPILNSLLLDGSNGALIVSASDIDTFHEAVVEKKSGQLAPFCVPAKPFLGLVEGAGEIIDIEADSKAAIIKSDGWARRMSILPKEEFVKRPDVKGMKQLACPAHLLADAIEAVAWAGDEAPSDNRMFKSLIWVEMEAKSLKTAATDSYKFAQHSQKLICSDLTFGLPLKAATLFCEALRGEDVQLLHNDKRIVVIHSTGFFACALPEEKWMDYRGILKGERIAIGSVAVAPLKATLERASTVYPIDDAPVTVRVEDGKWAISTDPGQDDYSDALEPAKKNTAKRSFRVNAKYVLQALKQFEAEDVLDFSMTPEELGSGGLFLERGDLLIMIARMNPLKK
jgi:DNA polymerase III sliding clamp (beta) subunit (PCNA family)